MKRKNTIKKNIEKRKFVLEYLEKNFTTNVCDQEFHEKWYSNFGGKRKETQWGAEPVYQAQRFLELLYKEGSLNRGVVSLGANWQPGFPKWVYGYTLKKKS